jgi:hypothetical protein
MASARLITAAIFLITSLCVAASVEVQATDSGDLAGVVRDENGTPVAAAQCKLENSSGQTYQAETDGAGRFTIRALPPGDYRVEVRKQGFFLLNEPTLIVNAGTNELALVLHHEQELHERVQVTAPSNQIDTQDTSQRSTLSARTIRDVPVPSSQDLQQSLVALPEIVRDNGNNLHVAGARSDETQYLLDGFEIGNPVNGMLTSRFNVDATRAAEVQAGRLGADYAHPGAGVVNLETVEGDDRWRFGTTNPLPGISTEKGVHIGNWYPRFTISGPIERGRIWFSDAISLRHTFDVVKQLPSDADTSEQWAGDNLFRLQFNLSSRHILHGNFLYNRAHNANVGLDALHPQSTTVTAEQSRSFVSLKDQLWLNDTLFEVGVAADSGVLDYAPQGTEPYLVFLKGNGGNYFQRLHLRGRRLQAMAGLTAASRHWHGTHQLSAGLNVAGLTYSQSAARTEIQAFGVDGALVRQSTFAGLANPQVSNTQAGAYLQDTWSIDRRLILQLGLRTDWDRFTQSAMAEPHVSVNVLPFADDRAKLAIGWGIHNVPLNLSLIGQAFDQQQLDEFFDSRGTAVVGPVVNRFVLPAGGLSQPRFTISSAGWQQKLAHNTLVGVELLVRNGYHGFAFVDQQPTQPGGVFLLQDHRKDRYRAATVSARHVFSESAELFVSYTRSESHSNQVLNPVLGSIFYAPQQPAPVAWDVPNRLLAWGWTPTRIWGIQLSWFFEYRTGYPFSVHNLQQQLVGAPNSSRFPDYANLNLGFEKKFAFHGYLWAARVEAVNVLGRQNPDTVVNSIEAPNFGTFAGGQGRAFTLRLRFAGRK